MQKLTIKFLIFCTFSILPVISYAWNYTGHVLIAQIAYGQLTPAKKKKADELAAFIFNQLPIVNNEN